MKNLLKEPLFHFLLIGLGLFFIFDLTGQQHRAGSNDASIVVGTAQIERIQDVWEKQWRRQPTEKELHGLIERFIQEEVLYREALAIGLEKDDTIIRRRLVQKMRFLIQDIADQNQPEEAELKAFFEENREQFKSLARISFAHIYFNPDHRGATAVKDALQVLDNLKANNIERASGHGDPFMLQHDYVEITRQEASRLFGSSFADDLFALRSGPWQGPIRSGYGIHLVRVGAYIPAHMPEFTEVKDRVRQEYIDIQRRKSNDKAIKDLKARYRIVIEEDSLKEAGIQATSLAQSGDTS